MLFPCFLSFLPFVPRPSFPVRPSHIAVGVHYLTPFLYNHCRFRSSRTVCIPRHELYYRSGSHEFMD